MCSMSAAAEQSVVLADLMHDFIALDTPAYERALVRFLDHDRRFGYLPGKLVFDECVELGECRWPVCGGAAFYSVEKGLWTVEERHCHPYV